MGILLPRYLQVGPNGVGKSTLLKLMAGDVAPTEGSIRTHSHLSLGRYHQHSAEVLDPNQSPLEFFMSTYPEAKRTQETWRGYLGMFGIQKHMQTSKISTLSDGQKSRIIFAMLCMKNPNVLLFDEPTASPITRLAAVSPVPRSPQQREFISPKASLTLLAATEPLGCRRH